MKQLLIDVEKLARSYEKFPTINSPHEGYAVILEEVDKLKDKIKSIELQLKFIWADIKWNNRRSQPDLNEFKQKAIQVASEAVKIAAMAQKLLDMEGKP